jgi:alpha-tubulin suppressor-like RCC1 family protein
VGVLVLIAALAAMSACTLVSGATEYRFEERDGGVTDATADVGVPDARDGGTDAGECDSCACATDRCIDGRCVPLRAATAIAAGTGHSCAVVDGVVHCWGVNARGQLGSNDRGAAGPLSTGLENAVAVVAGAAFSCALTGDGSIHCWGQEGNWLGIGGPVGDLLEPTLVSSGRPPWTTLAAGDYHVCAVSAADLGTAFCWGQGLQGELGRDEPTSHGLPVAAIPRPVRQVAAGVGHTLFLLMDGRIFCAGDNRASQCGFQAGLTSLTPPQELGSGARWITAAGGGEHSCGVADTGALGCVGRNELGQLGDGSTVGAGALAPGTSTGWAALTAGTSHTCGIDDTGALHCWGDNLVGQVGVPGAASYTLPERVTLDRYAEVSAGATHTCAIDEDGAVLCFGSNGSGQVVPPATVDEVQTPTRVCFD